jgi:tRNA A-37 threonylcarbamoyl transferase component Bud32
VLVAVAPAFIINHVSETTLFDPEREAELHSAGLSRAEDLFRLGGEPTLHRFGGVIRLETAQGTRSVYLKRYHYPNWARSKGLIGRGTLWGRAPEINEFHALAWLRRNGVPAARPLAAASRTSGGRLVSHALLTEMVPDAADLDTCLRSPASPVQLDGHQLRGVLKRVLEGLARMHALGFVHRDCHTRNIVVRLEQASPGIWFLDCRRGRVGGRKPVAYDLATLDLDLQGLISRTERLRALSHYEESRSKRRRLVTQVARLQAGLSPPRR